VLAACGGSSGGTSSSGSNSTLKIAVPAAFGTLDPNLGLQVDSEVSVQSDLFSSLVQLNPQLKIVGDMATSWQNPSPTVWVFKLRPGMKFQNGDPLDANTVVDNFQRMESKSLGSSWISDLTPYLQSVTAPDATTVKFQLKSPYTDFLYRLSYIFYIDTQWLPGHNPKLQANASGPYELVSFNPQSEAVLKANPSYYGKKPAYKNVDYLVEATSTDEINALQTNAVDVATAMAPNDMKSLASDTNLVTGSEPSLRNVFLWMTTVHGGPLANPLVRQAMNYAVDKQAIVNTIFGGKTEALKGQVLNGTYTMLNTSLEGYPYNPAKAKQLLAQAGYPNGFSTEMTYPTGTYPADDLVSQVLVQQYAAVGIKLKLNAIPFTSFVTMNVNAKSQATPLRYEGYASYTPSSAGMLYFFTSDHYTNAAPDPKYDELVNKYLTAPNATLAKQYFDETTQEMYDFAPMVFLYAQPLTYAYSKSVQWTPRPEGWLRAYDMTPANS
jgi:peptide/nickel transport system substrate-binding protein